MPGFAAAEPRIISPPEFRKRLSSWTLPSVYH
jgi:hypothetical protein